MLDSTSCMAISRGRLCERGPVCRKLGGKVPRVDGALTTQPRAQAAPPALRRPASATCSLCSPAPPWRAAEGEVIVDEFLQAQVMGEGGRQEQAGIGHQAVVVKDDADSVGIVVCQYLLGAPCFRAGFCSKTIIPDSEEHPLVSSRAVPKALPRWIRA